MVRTATEASPFSLVTTFKRTVSRDLLLLVFFMNQFPPSPRVYPIRTASNLFENPRKYSQVNVHHMYQRQRRKILPPVSLVLLIPVANLPPVSTIGAANLTPVANNGNNIRLPRPYSELEGKNVSIS
jgi:hypothetical protein